MRYVPQLLLYLLVGALTACIDAFDPQLPAQPPRLVVDGMLTNYPGPQRVRLSYDAPFSQNEARLGQRITDATVWITDDAGGRIDYVAQGQGVYASDVAGQAGRQYVLNIRLSNGKRYVSKPELLKAAPPIDTVYSEYERFTGRVERGQFRVYTDLKDPATPGDYYRWQWVHYGKIDYCLIVRTSGALIKYPCCIPCWNVVPSQGEINLASDRLTNGRTMSRQFITAVPYDTTSPYYLQIEQQRISKTAYQFWKHVKEQTQNTGGLFDRPAAPVPGNVVSLDDPAEQVLGFFGASGVVRRVVYIPRNTVGEPFWNLEIPFTIMAQCYKCQDDLFRTSVQPPEWRK